MPTYWCVCSIWRTVLRGTMMYQFMTGHLSSNRDQPIHVGELCRTNLHLNFWCCADAYLFRFISGLLAWVTGSSLCWGFLPVCENVALEISSSDYLESYAQITNRDMLASSRRSLLADRELYAGCIHDIELKTIAKVQISVVYAWDDGVYKSAVVLLSAIIMLIWYCHMVCFAPVILWHRD